MDIQNYQKNNIIGCCKMNNLLEIYIDENKNKYTNLELIIKPHCNHNCDYCYINHYGDELYPIEENNTVTILSNISEILKYVFVIKKLPIYNITLFSGNLFEDNLLWSILTLIENFKIKGLNIYIPLYPSFIKENYFIDLFEYYYNRFKKLGMNIIISISMDGRKVNTDRSYNYNDVIDFAEQYNYYFHSMVSASNVHKWIKNYDWWMRHVDMQPMIKEVRDNNWTQDKVDIYLKFLNHIFEKRLELCENDIEKFTYHYFMGDGANNTLMRLPYYDIIKPIFTDRKGMLCTLQNTLSFDVSTNILIPCHRIAYDQFKAAQLQDEKLVLNNVSTFMTLGSISRKGLPSCNSCIIKDFCMGPCPGAQFEAHGDLFTPNETVCNLFQYKILFILDKLAKMGALEIAIQNEWINKEFQNKINKMLNK